MSIDPIPFLSSFKKETFVHHVKTFINFYTNPISAWRKAYSNRKEGVDYVIIHAIYYVFLILILSVDYKKIFLIFLLEIVWTIVPTIVLYIPFYFFINRYKKQKKLKHLFRVLVTAKMQIYPIYIFSLVVSSAFKLEIFNWILLVSILINWILIIISIPIVSRISILAKTSWIFINYIFVLLFLSSVSISYNYFFNKEFVEFSNKSLAGISPPDDFSLYYDQLEGALDTISDSCYVISYHKLNPERPTYKYQLGSIDLVRDIVFSSSHKLSAHIKSLDSLEQIEYQDILLKLEIPGSYILPNLTYNYLDSALVRNTNMINKDLQVVNHAIKECKFESNRKYFKLLNELLTEYDSLSQNFYFEMPEKFSSIYITSIQPDESSHILLLKYETDRFINLKKQIKKIEQEFDTRESFYLFPIQFFAFPIEFIFYVIDKIEELN